MKFSLTEAVYEITSSALNLKYLPISEFHDSQEDVYFILHNAFNHFLKKSLESSDLYVKELFHKIASR